MVNGRGDGGSGREAASMEDDRRHKRQRGATIHRLKAPVLPDRRTVDRARGSMEDELYRKLDEDGGK